MAVAREWRGRGVGLELLAAAIEWARERGLHKLSLGVFAHNAPRSRSTASSGASRKGRRQALPARERRSMERLEMGLLL